MFQIDFSHCYDGYSCLVDDGPLCQLLLDLFVNLFLAKLFSLCTAGIFCDNNFSRLGIDKRQNKSETRADKLSYLTYVRKVRYVQFVRKTGKFFQNMHPTVLVWEPDEVQADIKDLGSVESTILWKIIHCSKIHTPC